MVWGLFWVFSPLAGSVPCFSSDGGTETDWPADVGAVAGSQIRGRGC